MDELDIRRTAHMLYTQSPDHMAEANRRLRIQMSRGDLAGVRTWKRIIAALRKMDEEAGE